MSTLLRLYPRAWLVRYGAELEDLTSSRPLGLGGSFDLLRGALDAHRHPELVDPSAAPRPTPVSRQRFEDLRVARRLGTASLVGAAVWVVGWFVALNGPMVSDGAGTYRDGSAAAPLILLAMSLLAAGLLGHLIRLSRRARFARAGAAVALLTGPVWGLAPWVLPIGAAALGGIVALAAAAWWSREWGAGPALAVIGSALGGVYITVTSLVTGTGMAGQPGDPMLVAVMLFTMLWLGVGAGLRQLPPVEPAVDVVDGVPVGRAPA